jgi:hypothetical protein
MGFVPHELGRKNTGIVKPRQNALVVFAVAAVVVSAGVSCGVSLVLLGLPLPLNLTRSREARGRRSSEPCWEAWLDESRCHCIHHADFAAICLEFEHVVSYALRIVDSIRSGSTVNLAP